MNSIENLTIIDAMLCSPDLAAAICVDPETGEGFCYGRSGGDWKPVLQFNFVPRSFDYAPGVGLWVLGESGAVAYIKGPDKGVEKITPGPMMELRIIGGIPIVLSAIGTLFQRKDNVWAVLHKAKLTDNLNLMWSLCGRTSEDLWTSGDGGRVYRHEGKSTKEYRVAKPSLRAIACGDDGTVCAAGKFGTTAIRRNQKWELRPKVKDEDGHVVDLIAVAILGAKIFVSDGLHLFVLDGAEAKIVEGAQGCFRMGICDGRLWTWSGNNQVDFVHN